MSLCPRPPGPREDLQACVPVLLGPRQRSRTHWSQLADNGAKMEHFLSWAKQPIFLHLQG